jgi:hypothetical protein
MRPDEVVNSSDDAGLLEMATGRSGAGESGKLEGGGTGCDNLCGKSGVVFALAGEPVIGGAAGLGGVCGFMLEETFPALLGIGFVTAVDQAGGTLGTGVGSNWVEVLIGSVDAAETFGRTGGVIFVDIGLRGRGGRLMRKVSRFGFFGSDPSGVTESAIIVFLSLNRKMFNGEIRNRNVFMSLSSSDCRSSPHKALNKFQAIVENRA